MVRQSAKMATLLLGVFGCASVSSDLRVSRVALLQSAPGQAAELLWVTTQITGKKNLVVELSSYYCDSSLDEKLFTLGTYTFENTEISDRGVRTFETFILSKSSGGQSGIGFLKQYDLASDVRDLCLVHSSYSIFNSNIVRITAPVLAAVLSGTPLPLPGSLYDQFTPPFQKAVPLQDLRRRPWKYPIAHRS